MISCLERAGALRGWIVRAVDQGHSGRPTGLSYFLVLPFFSFPPCVLIRVVFWMWSRGFGYLPKTAWGIDDWAFLLSGVLGNWMGRGVPNLPGGEKISKDLSLGTDSFLFCNQRFGPGRPYFLFFLYLRALVLSCRMVSCSRQTLSEQGRGGGQLSVS